jgi:hypothetical protein
VADRAEADPGRAPSGNGTASALRRHLLRLHNRSMLALLVLLVGAVFVAPALVDPARPSWRPVNDVFVLLILASGVIAVVEHRKLAQLLVALAVIVVALNSAEWVIPHASLPIVRYMATLCALIVLAVAVGINVFAPGHAVGDRVFGAIVLYLLLGVMWAFAYAMLNVLLPNAFTDGAGKTPALTEWIYFSFVTLTTVGYGDITPVARAARSLAMLEALVGQLYPAIIIARLVSLQIGSR